MDAWNIWNFVQYMQYEQAVLKDKYDKLLTFLAEILVKVKYDERMTNEPRTRCRYYNKGYCKQGQQCTFLHPSDICDEHLCSGSCSKGQSCQPIHPRKCKHWLNGKCWRGDMCAYLHKREDLKKHADKENISATDISKPENLVDHNVDVTNKSYDINDEVVSEIHQNFEVLDNNENYDADTSNDYCADESIDTIMAKAMAFDDPTESESEDTESLSCQGCGQNPGQFTCEECDDRFCNNCIISEQGQSRHICLNCE